MGLAIRYKELPLGNACIGSINSEGLPNKGIDYYLDPGAISAALDNGKPYIVSLSGKSLDDNLKMLTAAWNTEGVAAVELNLACPNIIGKRVSFATTMTQKGQARYYYYLFI